jgi:glyoxylase-like metal-dependent hydrolase (beta-lactamase superfamily II)/rhodanese-related sulfurtransferase
MSVRRLGHAACRSYLLTCDRTRAAVLVDPLHDDAVETAALLEREGLRPAWIVDTHTHADHLSAGPALAERTGAPYALHESSGCARPHERLRDGQILEAGDLRVEVLHTPGHTADSVTLHSGRDLLTGDFLFLAQDGAGRLDLPGGDAGAHWDSLRRLAALEDGTRVLPGHDYAGLDDSTLGVERVRNPRFQEITRAEYEAWQRAVAAPTPDWMLEVIAANLGTAAAHAAHHAPRPVDLGLTACPSGGACATAPSGRVPLVTPAEAARRARGGTFFLDVREPHETRALRAEGVEVIPLGTLPASLDRLPADRGAEILVICKTGGRSAQAAEALIGRGWRRVFSVAGGTERWAAEGLPVRRG